MKKVTLIRGPLGVGKSTISRLLVPRIGADYLSLERILMELKAEGFET